MRVHVVAIIALLFVPAALGHVPGEEEVVPEGIQMEFLPLTLPVGREVVYGLKVFNGTEPVAGARVTFEFASHAAGISDTVEAAEDVSGNYFANYTIGQPQPDWEVNVQVAYDGQELLRTYELNVVAGPADVAYPVETIGAAIVVIIVIVVAAALVLRRK